MIRVRSSLIVLTFYYFISLLRGKSSCLIINSCIFVCPLLKIVSYLTPLIWFPFSSYIFQMPAIRFDQYRSTGERSPCHLGISPTMAFHQDDNWKQVGGTCIWIARASPPNGFSLMEQIMRACASARRWWCLYKCYKYRYPYRGTPLVRIYNKRGW